MQTFQIATASARALWFLLPIGAIPLVIIGVVTLLYVTDPTKAVYVPARLDYSVIVTPKDPDGFLSAVRAIAPTP